MVKAKELFEVLGITKQFEQQKEQEQQYGKKMDLSQIAVIYRAEGNANLVLALPQFKKVLRLPKANVQQPKVQQHQQQPKYEQYKQINEETGEHSNTFIEYQNSLLKQQQQQQPELALTIGHRKNQKDGNHLTMEHYAAYIDVIRCLLGNEFIFEVDVVDLPNPNDNYWINKHIRSQRPVNRLDKELFSSQGLLLPDATQLPPNFDLLFSNLQSPATISDDTYAIEIKPKQGWLLCTEFYNLLNKKPKLSTSCNIRNNDCHYYENMQSNGWPQQQQPQQQQQQQQQQHHHHHNQEQQSQQRISQPSLSASLPLMAAMNASEMINITCRYCSMQFLKLKQQRIQQLSSYCPRKLFSGNPDKMLEALNALFQCPQNNLRIYRNGQLVYDEELSKRYNVETIFTSNKLDVIKNLVVTCLLRNYDDNSVTTRNTTIITRSVTPTTVRNATDANTISTSQSNLRTRTATKIQNLQTSLNIDESYIEQLQQQKRQIQHKQQKSKQNEQTLKLVEYTPTFKEAEMASVTLPLHTGLLKAELASTTQAKAKATITVRTIYPNINSMRHDTAEMLRLPINCVLQKILHLQLLAKKNFLYMFEKQKQQVFDKTYNYLQKLLQKYQMNRGILNFSQLDNDEEYLLGATALDCSIMITFREILPSIENLSSFSSLNRYLIDIPELSGRFLSKVTILDLDPKPDNHYARYCQQTEHILNLFESNT